MTTKERLQKYFDGKDISSLIEILEMWKENPQNLLNVYVSGMLTFDYKEAKSGLIEFSNIFNAVTDALCDTEDGKHFYQLYCIIESYIDILDWQKKSKSILN